MKWRKDFDWVWCVVECDGNQSPDVYAYRRKCDARKIFDGKKKYFIDEQKQKLGSDYNTEVQEGYIQVDSHSLVIIGGGCEGFDYRLSLVRGRFSRG